MDRQEPQQIIVDSRRPGQIYSHRKLLRGAALALLMATAVTQPGQKAISSAVNGIYRAGVDIKTDHTYGPAGNLPYSEIQRTFDYETTARSLAASAAHADGSLFRAKVEGFIADYLTSQNNLPSETTPIPAGTTIDILMYDSNGQRLGTLVELAKANNHKPTKGIRPATFTEVTQ